MTNEGVSRVARLNLMKTLNADRYYSLYTHRSLRWGAYIEEQRVKMAFPFGSLEFE